MSFWPFRRRGKRGRRQADDGINNRHEETQAQPRSFTSPPPHENSSAALARRDSKRRKRDSAPNHVGQEPAPASPPRRPFGAAITSRSHTDLRNAPLHQPLSADTFPQRNQPPSQHGNNMSHTSLPGNSYDPPTLSVKKNTERNLLRRKSDKRKRSEQAREQEIRDMVAAQSSVAGRGHHAQGGANASGALLRPPSSPETPSGHSFKVSAFNALIPRPILRYKEKNNRAPAPSRSVSRSSVVRGKQPTANERKLAEEDRIDELADDMDASALRELLERDRRRSVKSREAQNLLHQKLQREVSRRGEASGPPKTTWPLSPSQHSGSWLADSSKENLTQNGRVSQESHWDRRHANETAVASSSQDAPRADNKESISTISNIPGPKERSTSDLSHTVKAEKRNSGSQITRSLAGIFRRPSSRMKKQLDSNEQSGFSVPSRESIIKTQQTDIDQTPAVPPKSILRKASTNHGTSRFTEHLNDFPMPPKQVASSAAPSAADDMNSASRRVSTGTGVGTIDRYCVSAMSTADVREGRMTGGNSPEARPDSLLLAQSLASIDSEGSWLSGKPSRRLSQAPHTHLNKSACSVSDRLDESAESGEGEASTLGEEIFGTIPLEEEEGEQDNGRKVSDFSTRTVRDDNDIIGQEPEEEEEEKGTLHAGAGKRPRLISPETRARSTEGLFTSYQQGLPDDNAPDVPEMPLDDDSEVYRATSIDFGKGHARQISAGSARLLDLSNSRRPSDAKTLDSEPSKANRNQRKE